MPLVKRWRSRYDWRAADDRTFLHWQDDPFYSNVKLIVIDALGFVLAPLLTTVVPRAAAPPGHAATAATQGLRPPSYLRHVACNTFYVRGSHGGGRWTMTYLTRILKEISARFHVAILVLCFSFVCVYVCVTENYRFLLLLSAVS
jgi:hypothetical protein